MTDRDATPADAEAIAALFATSFTATFGHLYAAPDLATFLAGFTLAGWRAELADPAIAVRVAEIAGTLAGFAKSGPLTLPVTPTGPARELRQLYLADAAKGTGLAQALTAWTIADARARGAHELFLSVYIDNIRAIRFYERLGFVDIGAYVFMVGTHADEDRLMRLTL